MFAKVNRSTLFLQLDFNWWSRSTHYSKFLSQSRLSGEKMTGKYKIVMVRHGESEWNLKNQFCGWFDSDLSENGKK